MYINDKKCSVILEAFFRLFLRLCLSIGKRIQKLSWCLCKMPETSHPLQIISSYNGAKILAKIAFNS